MREGDGSGGMVKTVFEEEDGIRVDVEKMTRFMEVS